MDENVKRSIVWSLADDTRTNKKINNLNNIKEMSEDLNTIYKLAIKNKRVFNEIKLEQMTFGHTKNTPITQ